VERTQEPPIYDALTYFQKAQNVWNNLEEKEIVNPFNLQPTVRPPGTVLMSYPFGFNKDPRPFYFRSIFLPILFFISAIFVVLYSRGIGQSEKWDVCLISLFLSTLPMFYHFGLAKDTISLYHWGLVDSFLAGVAAFGTAAWVRSVKHWSLGWLMVGVFFTSFSVLVKPAGGLIMLLAGLTWLATTIFRIRSVGRVEKERKIAKRFLFLGLAAFSTVYALVLFACLSSMYFSPKNMSYGKIAAATLRAEWKPDLTIPLFGRLIHISLGSVFPAVVILTGVLAILYWKRAHADSADWTRAAVVPLIAAASLYLSVGMWFWIIETSANQVRYFFPFALMAIICTVPVFMQLIKKVPLWMKSVLRVVFMLPVINLALLLVQSQPPLEWQKLTGVNLSVGAYEEEIRQARDLVKNVRKIGENPRLYSFYSGPSVFVFENVLRYEASVAPSEANFQIGLPVTWQGPTTYDLGELLDSDYILFEPVRKLSDKVEALSNHSIDNFYSENLLMHAWFTDLKEEDGITVISETPLVRLLKICDRVRFEASLEALKKRYAWRTAFLEANSEHWMSLGDLADLLKKYSPAIQDVAFNNVFKIHALSLESGGREITVRLWWEQMDESLRGEFTISFYLFDDEGRVLYTKGMLGNLKPELPDKRIRFGTMKMRYPMGAHVKTFGVEICKRLKNECLRADKGLRNNDGTRALIPLPIVRSRMPINPEEVHAIVSRTKSEYQSIQFGNRFILLGQDLVRTSDGLQIQFAWKSITRQKLSFVVAVHWMDETKKILSQSDYLQDEAGLYVGAGSQWLDKIDIPNSRLKEVVSVGIAIYSVPDMILLPVDKGLRDWKGKRLLISVPRAY
jgi:hypothetical protein